MVNKSFNCSNGLLMPDGTGWCSITMEPCSGCEDSFESGKAQLYKPLPQEEVTKQKVVKVKVREVKPIPIIKSNKKIITKQQRLF